jgi:hypothetical protein
MGLTGSSSIGPRTWEMWSFPLVRDKAQLQSVTEFTCNMGFRDLPKTRGDPVAHN